MSTRENIRLIARAPIVVKHIKHALIGSTGGHMTDRFLMTCFICHP